MLSVSAYHMCSYMCICACQVHLHVHACVVHRCKLCEYLKLFTSALCMYCFFSLLIIEMIF